MGETITIQQWGNSAAVRIPQNILKESGLKINDSVELIAFQGGITLRKKEKKDLKI